VTLIARRDLPLATMGEEAAPTSGMRDGEISITYALLALRR